MNPPVWPSASGSPGTPFTFVPNPPPPMFDMVAPGHHKAIHMSLIPKGPHQGRLLVWDHQMYTTDPANDIRPLYWAIVDPVTKQNWNYMWRVKQGWGDLFCVGSAWTADGQLLVTGGTGWHGNGPIPYPPIPGPNGWTGSKLAMLFDPSVPYVPNRWWIQGNNPWTELLEMAQARWYPTVLAVGDNPTSGEDVYLVMGGTDNGFVVNSYEAWRHGFAQAWQQWGTPATRIFPPPFGASHFGFGDYPRAHLATNGLMSTAGMNRGSSRNDHHRLTGLAAGVWWEANDPGWVQAAPRGYGTSVLLPFSSVSPATQNLVMSMGGHDWGTGAILASVQTTPIGGPVAPRTWSNAPSLAHQRWVTQSVLLPDSTVLVVGGEKASTQIGCASSPAYFPELLAGGSWQPMAGTDIVRDYHSTALLLPSGKVMVAGGESREYHPGVCPQRGPLQSHPVDYQVFVPPYLQCGGLRPVIRNQAVQGSAWTWSLGAQQIPVEYDELPFGVWVDHAVLVRAGSVTHHCDPNQRCVRLATAQDPAGLIPQVLVDVPASSYLLPRGYYMLFLVTNQGVPSEAAWVQIQ